MSDYSDIYYDMNRAEIESSNKADKYRKRMVEELSTDDMVRIIFKHHVSKLFDYAVLDIAEKYLEAQ